MIGPIVSAFLLATFAFFAYRRNLRYLHIFQQEEYDNRRFVGWLFAKRTFDKRLSLAILVVLAAGALAAEYVPSWLSIVALGCAFLSFAMFEPDPRLAAKKKLSMTERALRTHYLALTVVGLTAVSAAYLGAIWPWLVAVQVIPFSLPIANLLLQPLERRIQDSFRGEAVQRLKEIGPHVVGITGSYGKTSVKHMLGHILALNSRTLITPGSINTPMGITRVIRESLNVGCQNFVVEMGAYGRGSISRLCALTPPSLGIITAIGEAHFERFKSLDTVAQTKFELAEAVLSGPDGVVLIDEGVLDNPYAQEFVVRNRSRFIVCGTTDGADLRICSSATTAQGIDAEISWKGTNYLISAPVYGSHQIRNVALAFAAAVTLGVSPERALFSLRSTPQVKHRLEVKAQADGSVIIDDAYNSNPTGFAAALEVLPVLKKSGGRSILVTPGMAELGVRHDAAHLEVGRKAAKFADLALVVKPERIPSFIEGFCGEVEICSERMFKFETFSDANAWLSKNRKQGDVVLLENDLPDLYEREFCV